MAVAYLDDQQRDAGPMIRWGETFVPREWFHPTWLVREAQWRRFKLSYEGGDDFIFSQNPTTLFSHPRETDESYTARKRRAYYRNHCAAVIGLKADAIYQPQVLRAQGAAEGEEGAEEDEPQPPRVRRAQAGEADPSFEAFLKDVDLRGTNADPFFDEVARLAMVYGCYYIGIAMSAAPELEAKARAERRLVTESEALAQGLRPFYFTSGPLSVINWACDERGRLTFAVLLAKEESRIPLPRQNEKQPKPRFIARVLYPTHEERFLLGPRGGQERIGVFPHSFGAVPLVPVCLRSDCRSMIEDISRLNMCLFNLDSLVDEQIYGQTFNQLIATGIKDKKEFRENVTGVQALIALGDGEDMKYLAPEVQTIAQIRERIGEIEDAIWAIANLRGRPGGGKGAQPAADVSGIAYAFEFKHAETDLANLAVRLEEVELKLGAMRERALGLAAPGAPSGFTCAYPREFDVRALLARANEVQQLLAVNLGDTAHAELRKQLVRKAMPRLRAGMLSKIDAEIDAGVVEKPPAAQPPNQGRMAAGTGASEDRMMRAVGMEMDEDAFEAEAANG